MIVAGLARVSTDHREQDASIEAQIQQLQDAGCDRVFAERASAYRHGVRRPGWEELQALVAAGQVREVVAVSQSRLSRSGEDLTFLRMCHRRGVTVRFLDGTPGDLGDPAGRLMAGVLSTVNEVDSLIKSINVKNGLNRRKAAGHYACGRVPFGYRVSDGKVSPDPASFAKARQLWQQLQALEFNLPRAIRDHQLSWSVRGLGLWLRNPILLGTVRGEMGATEALISYQELAQALAMMDRRRTRRTRAPRTIRPLSGLVRCQSCSCCLHYVQVAGKQRMKCTQLACRWYGRGLAEWKIRQQVIDALRGGAAFASLLPTGEPRPTPEQDHRHQQLQQLLSLQASGVGGLQVAIDDLRSQLAAPLPQAEGPNWAGLEALICRPGVLEAASDEELRAVVLELIDEVVYVGDPNTVEVRLRGSTGSDA
jgi:DNA invertase Pin-like site-specific DNA recombinase